MVRLQMHSELEFTYVTGRISRENNEGCVTLNTTPLTAAVYTSVPKRGLNKC